MQAVSDGYLDVVSGSHRTRTRVLVYPPGGGAVQLPGTVSGQVTEDSTRSVMRTLDSLVISNPDMIPSSLDDDVNAYGAEVKIYRDVWVDGAWESASLGVFRITGLSVVDTGRGIVMSCSGYDRSTVVQAARLDDVVELAAGDTEDVISALAQDRFPGVPVSLPTMGTLPKQVLTPDPSTDPWRRMREMAQSDGYHLYFDVDGVLSARVPPTFDDSPSVVLGGAAGRNVMTSMDRQQDTSSQMYNGVVVTGEATSLDAPVLATVYDEDPDSPTYVGRIGYRPRFWSSPLVETEHQAELAAASMLAGLLGQAEMVGWSQIPNPALETFDVVSVTRERAGLSSATVLVDRIVTPLGHDGLQRVSGRRRLA